MKNLFMFVMMITLMSLPTYAKENAENGSQCVKELSRWEVHSGCAQRKQYKLDQNKRQVRFHQDHKAQNNGELVYLPDHELHLETKVLPGKVIRVYVYNKKFEPETNKGFQAKIAFVDKNSRYIFYKLNSDSTSNYLEVKLSDSFKGGPIEMFLRFPNTEREKHLEFHTKKA